ncbi:MAG: DUF6884 domain-containing protein [Anaerolineaceae bacterium]
MQTIALVSCVSKKRTISSAAQNLYLSDWYLKASAYAKKVGNQWFILSAKYGLLAPDKVVEPYNVTLKTMPIHSRRLWAARVIQELQPILSLGDTVIFLAGDAYRENLITPIQNMGCQISIPMQGLRIGEQLHWLNNQLRGK